MKKNLKYAIPLIITLAILIFIKIIEPDPVDWSGSFSKDDKIAFGNEILFDILPEFFQDNISVANLPVYNTLKNNSSKNSNYILINESVKFDQLDKEYLLEFIERGNNVFISALTFGRELSDTLELNTYYNLVQDDSVGLNFTNPNLKNVKDYYFTKFFISNHFTVFDTSNVTVLGNNSSGKINFIKMEIGKGSLYLHSSPFVFTNYYMMKQASREYIYKTFSYLPVRETIWDEYYKPGNQYAETPLRYFLSQEPLRWSYFIFAGLLLLLFLFQTKRNQKIIPVISPLKNTTTEFIGTIGNLYYQQKDHKNIAVKKITHFYDFVRTRYNLKGHFGDEEFLQTLSDKSGLEKSYLGQINSFINLIEKREDIPESELKTLNDLIDNFYKQTGAYGKPGISLKN